MSADMMVVCKEDGSYFGARRASEEVCPAACFIDETSMGWPHNEFGRWFQSRFSGAPSVLEQLHGMKNHHWTVFTEPDLASIREALERFDRHADLDKDQLIDYLTVRVGKHISTENW